MPARSAMRSASAGSTRYRRGIKWPAGVLGWTIANGHCEIADGWESIAFFGNAWYGFILKSFEESPVRTLIPPRNRATGLLIVFTKECLLSCASFGGAFRP